MNDPQTHLVEFHDAVPVNSKSNHEVIAFYLIFSKKPLNRKAAIWKRNSILMQCSQQESIQYFYLVHL